MKTNRSFWAVFFLSFITFGIYPLVFWFKFAKDVNIACARDGRKTMNYIGAMLLGLVTFGIYPIIWWYQVTERLFNNASLRGTPALISGGGYLLWSILGSCIIVGPFIAGIRLIKMMNGVAEHYNAYGA